MITKVEELGKSMVKLTIEADAKSFEDAIEKAYLKNKKHISIPGFRKGKVPRVMIERTYGKEVFYEDAANELIPEVYAESLKESELEIVSRPDVDVVQIEKGKPFIFTVEVAVKPEVKLGLYKGLEVELSDATVSDEDVEAELKQVAEKNARLVEVEGRAVQDGDTANIDFEGFLDGVAFEGGKGEGYDLVIGSGSFIPGFEEQVIGKKLGEEAEITVTFPVEYGEKTLAGKEVVFKIKVNTIKVKELPEINDDFADDVSDFETLAEYKEDLRKNLEHQKAHAREHEKEDKVIGKAVEQLTVELPEPMVEFEAERMADDFGRRLSMQGLELEQYLQFTGGNMATFMEGMKKQAEDSIKVKLMLEEVVKIEKLEVSDEEFEKELERISEQYGMELEALKGLGEEEHKGIKGDILNKKAVELLVKEAVEK